MTILQQILWGTIVLAGCSVLHVGMVSWIVRVLPRISKWTERSFPSRKVPILVGSTFSLLVLVHLVQIAIWSILLIWLDAFDGFEAALYFSLVTYTTLGYGDLVLEPDLRLFASFASITGLLTFGLSTALLVGLFGRLLKQDSA